MSANVPDRIERSSSIRQILEAPLYRGATISMFLLGLGMSAAAPQIALFLVKELGASLPTAGLYYIVNLTAPVAGYLVGSRSDRTGNRLRLFRVCAIAGFIGWIGIALSTEVWMPFTISALFLGFSGASGSQLFAAVHDQLEREPGSDTEGVVSVIRMALTAGWVIGPVVGAWLASTLGPRVMFFLVALCILAQIAPLGTLRAAAAPRETTGSSSDGKRRSGPTLAAMVPLLAFTALYVMVYSGEPIKYGYLPIYMNEQLKLPPAVSGAVIGIQPLIELILMPVSLIVGRRIGLMQIMAVGALFGVGANLCFATTGSAIGMFGGQFFMGGVWGIFAAMGIIAAQRLLPTAVATASAIFMSAPAIGSVLGGLSGSLGVATLGLPHVYFVPGFFALLASIGLAAMAKARVLDK